MNFIYSTAVAALAICLSACNTLEPGYYNHYTSSAPYAYSNTQYYTPGLYNGTASYGEYLPRKSS